MNKSEPELCANPSAYAHLVMVGGTYKDVDSDCKLD
jgi:hypothetical protein